MPRRIAEETFHVISAKEHWKTQAPADDLALAVPDFGSHTTFLATNLSSTLTRLLSTHEPIISGIRT